MAVSFERAESFADDVELIDEDIRYEVLDNVIYLMAASPLHEDIVMDVGSQLKSYFKGKPCTVYGSNLQYDWSKQLLEAGFYKPEDRKPKFLPDISVICDKSKFAGISYTGAPSLIVEVVSDSSYDRDFGRKKEAYALMGVKEYWVIVYPFGIHRFILDGNVYREEAFSLTENITSIPVYSFPDLSIEFNKSEIDK